MKKISKFLLCLASIFMLDAVNVFAQAAQITRFGVVDTAKVYSVYFKDSTAVRNYEKKRSDFEAEVTRLTEELRTLNNKKLEYQRNGNDTQAMKTQGEINKKQEYLTEYTSAKNVELESIRYSLQNADEFYQKLYKTLEQIAESGGYSMILSLQENNAILWYSNSVDITNQVIKKLGL